MSADASASGAGGPAVPAPGGAGGGGGDVLAALAAAQAQAAQAAAALAAAQAAAGVTREFNRAADAACNGDIPAFKAEVRFLLGADVVFHEIQPESTEIGDLVAFKSQHALRR